MIMPLQTQKQIYVSINSFYQDAESFISKCMTISVEDDIISMLKLFRITNYKPNRLIANKCILLEEVKLIKGIIDNRQQSHTF